MTRREILERLHRQGFDAGCGNSDAHDFDDVNQALTELQKIEEAERLTEEEIEDILFIEGICNDIDFRHQLAQAILSTMEKKRGERCPPT